MAVYDASGSQSGDHEVGNVAGGSITQHGADADAVVREAFAIIRATFLDDSRRENRQATTDNWHRRILIALVALVAATVVQSLLLVATIAALVSLLWPRLAAGAWP